MPDAKESRKSKKPRPLKLIAISASGLMLGAGLCGVGQNEFRISALFLVLGFIVALVSLPVFIAGIILAVREIILGSR